ncbi:hypothetical protein [Mycobacterium marinum]|uniref:hypothetical protein n=2 Tax=Mycobacterium marinum TaxID=1781 RepID=UPI0012DE1F53|nr:hypothetical protein [Mycobacterium marinum]
MSVCQWLLMAAMVVLLLIAGLFASDADVLAVKPLGCVDEAVRAELYVDNAGRHTGCGCGWVGDEQVHVFGWPWNSINPVPRSAQTSPTARQLVDSVLSGYLIRLVETLDTTAALRLDPATRPRNRSRTGCIESG